MAESKISFFTKEEIRCPVCAEQFKREEILTGRGRLNAKELSPELRRIYEPTAKFGAVYPLVYTLNVCPNCWFAALANDFGRLAPEKAHLLADLTDYRKELIKQIFRPLVVDFYEPRDLISGAASYILALTSYSFYPDSFAPTFQRAIFSLRAAWIFGDLASEHNKYQGRFYKIQEVFYMKAKHYYNKSYEVMSKNKERFESVYLGPDTDKNYGYDGFIYLINYLNFKTAYLEEDIMKKADIYQEIKRNIGRIFGIGKASKEKPGPLLQIVRELYEDVAMYLQEIEESTDMHFEDTEEEE